MQRRTPLSIPESDPRACSQGARILALERSSLFGSLDHAQLHRVDAHASMRPMEAGEAIHLAGQPAERLHVIATGAVKLTGTTGEGTEVLLDVVGPGAFVGTLPNLGGRSYTDSAWALTAGCLLSFDAPGLEGVLREFPGVVRHALAAVGERLQIAQQRIQRAATSSARVRIAGTLLTLAEQLGVGEDERVLIDVPLARDDLASLAGCAAETVSRTLAAWQRDGVIDAGRRWVAIRDPAALAEVAGTTTSLRTPTG